MKASRHGRAASVVTAPGKDGGCGPRRESRVRHGHLYRRGQQCRGPSRDDARPRPADEAPPQVLDDAGAVLPLRGLDRTLKSERVLAHSRLRPHPPSMRAHNKDLRVTLDLPRLHPHRPKGTPRPPAPPPSPTRNTSDRMAAKGPAVPCQ